MRAHVILPRGSIEIPLSAWVSRRRVCRPGQGPVARRCPTCGHWSHVPADFIESIVGLGGHGGFGGLPPPPGPDDRPRDTGRPARDGRALTRTLRVRGRTTGPNWPPRGRRLRFADQEREVDDPRVLTTDVRCRAVSIDMTRGCCTWRQRGSAPGHAGLVPSRPNKSGASHRTRYRFSCRARCDAAPRH